MVKAWLIAAALLAANGAQAFEFKSVGVNPAVMYDAPSERGRKVFVAPRGMPVEVVLTYGGWSKVRDAGGDLAWVDSKVLVPKRNVVARAAARVRSAADDNASVVFAAERGVILEWLETGPAGWVKVRHRDGQSGFVRASEVWGD
ncbi:MAG: hypothetical protein K0S28_798 [Paucimonas sp.]|jgi:SH3-like domain-containing protein|nr:hypothetical protein [Paucimonas sp.]